MYQNLCSTMGQRFRTTFWPENLVIQRSHGTWHFSIDDSPIDNDDFPQLCCLVGGFNPPEKYSSVGTIIPNWMEKNKMLQTTNQYPQLPSFLIPAPQPRCCPRASHAAGTSAGTGLLSRRRMQQGVGAQQGGYPVCQLCLLVQKPT